MPWKINDKNELAVDSNGNPIFITDSGEEKPADYVAMIKNMAAANGESAERKVKIRELEKKLDIFKDIDDIESWHKTALNALETVKSLPDKDKAIEDRLRAQVESATKPLQDEIAALKKAKLDADTKLKKETIANAFTRSSYVKDKLVDSGMASDLFSHYFDISEDGNLFATGSDGKVIYSSDGVAGFDDAMVKLVDNYPGKNYLLKGNNSVGSGATPTIQNKDGVNRISRNQFEQLSPLKQSELMLKGNYQVYD
jgi:hypothetical protein